jgi:hypothetical protein
MIICILLVVRYILLYNELPWFTNVIPFDMQCTNMLSLLYNDV